MHEAGLMHDRFSLRQKSASVFAMARHRSDRRAREIFKDFTLVISGIHVATLNSDVQRPRIRGQNCPRVILTTQTRAQPNHC